MSSHHATTTRPKAPRKPAAATAATAAPNAPAVILKLPYGPTSAPPPRAAADLEAYLDSPDGADAEFWQIVALAAMRRHVNKPLRLETYARIRAALAEDGPRPRRARRRTA
jgi:hypothetical protein